jgi:hypothetical protein
MKASQTRRKGGVELVTDKGSDVTKVKIDGGLGVPIREELDRGILPCETLEGQVTEPGIQDQESFYEAPLVGGTTSVPSVHLQGHLSR